MSENGPAWWQDAVVYEVYPRSFADADGNGVGDLPGLRSRLPYLADLGVDAVWLTPFYPSPLADGGYDVIDDAKLVWRICHRVIREYQAEHPEGLFVRHEDLSTDPLGGFAADGISPDSRIRVGRSPSSVGTAENNASV